MAAAICTVHWARPQWDPGAHRLLSAEERDRYERLRNPADRNRFLTGRALMRTTLGTLLNCRPEDVPIRRDCRHCGQGHGKPYVPEARTRFSLSHSGTWVALAVCETGEPGVDVQQVGAGDYERLAPKVLSDVELGRFAALPAQVREAAFGIYWSRKEAVLKATGHGLVVPMTQLTVAGHRVPTSVLAFPGLPGGAAIALADLDAGPRYSAAVAVIGATSLVVDDRRVAALAQV
ncbi:4'-phosphopantetheinyl transferase superfamily protein [Micromonospora sp. NPDC049044]|uniref:4'-phosphopantetheinyl transferase family protein n=1 Tax=unclassified Micromonospora TaxID=2617518 RepID=UPI0034083C60